MPRFVVDGAKIKSGKRRSVESVVSVDPNAAEDRQHQGQNVYGIHATLKNMDLEGDVVHTADKENRGMTVYLEADHAERAIKDASIKMNRLSKWFGNRDSNVTIVGDVDVSQIDAPAGVTITAIAGRSRNAQAGKLRHAGAEDGLITLRFPRSQNRDRGHPAPG